MLSLLIWIILEEKKCGKKIVIERKNLTFCDVLTSLNKENIDELPDIKLFAIDGPARGGGAINS